MRESYVNAYVDGGELLLLARQPDGSRVVRREGADYAVFFRAEDLPAQRLQSLRREPLLLGCHPPDAAGWVRTRWADYRARREAVERLTVTWGIRTYEGDVSPARRRMIDRDCAVDRPRRAYFDLETDSRVPFSRKEEMRILSWVITDDAMRTRVGVLDRDDPASERKLLMDFYRTLNEYDQALAWNGDGFDVPVIKARTELCGLNRSLIRRWLWLDQMQNFRRQNMHGAESGDEKQSFALDAIATALLGRGKSDFDPSQTYQEWAAGGSRREAMVRYMVNDGELLPAIEAENGYVDLLLAICQASCTFPDSFGMLPTSQWDGVMMRLGARVGVHFHTRSRSAQRQQKFRGAWVMTPTCSGIQRDVHVFDFSGMYPSIILSWNMSPETKRARCDAAPPAGTCRSATGLTFEAAPRGLLPQGVWEIGEMRRVVDEKKGQEPPGTPAWRDLDRSSQALKVVRNGGFGVASSDYSRFGDAEVGEAITQTGRWLIETTFAEGARRIGLSALYGDSVAGDRTVVVRDPKGRVHIEAVETLWARFPGVYEARGKQFAEPAGSWEALAVDAYGHSGWFPLERIIRHRVDKKLWKISNKRGQVEVTEDHSVMLAPGVECAPAEFVSRGAPFVSVRAPASEHIGGDVDLFEFLSEWSQCRSCKGRVRTYRFEALRETVCLAGWGTSSDFPRRFYAPGSPEMRSLLRVMAAYIAEGSASITGLTTTRNMFTISQKDRAWLEALSADLQVVCPGAHAPVMDVGGGMFAIRAGSACLSHFFAALCGWKSRGKRLPSFVYDLSWEDAMVFWEKLLEGDGHRYPTGQVSYTTISQQLAAGLSYVLDQHGVGHRIAYRAEKRAWTLSTRPSESERSRRATHVEVRDARQEWVYDLSVAGAHTFVDGMGRVLLHNTDSGFATGVSEGKFREFVDWCNAELYPRLTTECGCAENHVKLAFEKTFDRLIIVSKKRYCASYKSYKGKAAVADSKPEIKGLEYKRGDASVLARRLQGEVIDLLCGGLKLARAPVPSERLEDYEEAVLRHRAHVVADPLPVGEVLLSQGLNRELGEYVVTRKKDGTAGAGTMHVRVARELESRGEDVSAGTKVKYVVVDGHSSPKRVVPASDYEGECDRVYLWNSRVYPATERLLVAAFPDGDWARFRLAAPSRRVSPNQTSLFAADGVTPALLLPAVAPQRPAP